MTLVHVIPCRTDNYVFVAGLPNRREVVVVDPCDGPPVLKRLHDEALQPVAILNTHHHGDHVGGNLELLREYPQLRVFAHESDRHRIPGITDPVEGGQTVDVAGMQFRVLFIPGHTRGHIAYVNDELAFVGDTLFGAGCGRLFEGTAQQMYHALNHELARLSPTADIYFAHEYTAANLRFAEHIEPSNPAIRERIAMTAQRRAVGLFTTPTQLPVELETNPFLRVHLPQVKATLGAAADAPPEEVFRLLRLAKDQFR